ncbi:DUF3575 domain-containing protein [Bacteroides sp.]|uniref:DUF3575 domain-containing protein n=1 Tax=Bacteroides sp. TaxID=29523 RepID=UPI0025BFA352|nr:DUF3575 domain-containing protein [Bacteroides sp.]
MNISIKRSVFHTSENNRTYLCSGVFFFLLLLCNTTNLRAQRVALKTNLADWGTGSPNISAEFAISNSFSLDLTGAGSIFKPKNNLYFRHVRLQPELRYWFRNLLSRYYIGITAFYSTYDVGYKKRGAFGDAYATGVTYGYNWILSRRWNFELCGGIGAIYYRMVHYTPPAPHPHPNKSGWMVAPVKLGISFVYILK